MKQGTGYLALAGTLVVAWFLYFAADGLWAPFTLDDLMNLHGYMQKSWGALLIDNVLYWSTAFRPMGGLFYVAVYHLFGFDPLPFRVVCFALLGLNLALLFVFIRQISGSREAALFGTFVLSYHAWFVDLYYSSGTAYELLCFAFYFTAFNLYVRRRQAGQLPGWGESLGIAALYICAMNSKEMAVTLPLFLLVYEAIFQPPRIRSLGSLLGWLRSEARTGIITGILTIPYAVGKLTGTGSLVENPAYQVSISPGRFLDTFHLYLNPFLYQDHVFRDSNTIQILIVMLAFALWRRSRSLAFGWLFLLLSILPVAFINHYSAFFMYIPSAGWAIYAGELLTLIRRGVTHVLYRMFRVEQQAAATAVVAAGLVALLLPLHVQERVKTSALFRSALPPSREIASRLLKERATMPTGGRVLFVNDPFPKNEYFLLFLVRLLYKDMTLQVARTAVQPLPTAEYNQYDAVFVFEGTTITPWRPS